MRRSCQGGRRRRPRWGWGLAALALCLVGGSDPSPEAPESWRIPEADLYGVDSRGERVWAVGYWGTALRSSDAGGTWQHSPTPVHDTLYDVSFADAQTGWAVGENGVVLRSRDGGVSWARQSVSAGQTDGAAQAFSLHLLGVAAVSPREAWAVGDLGAVLRTRDGERWEQVAIPPEAFADDETPERILNAVDFADASHGWIAGEFGTVLRTRDGGATWRGERRFLDAPADLYLFGLSAMDAQRVAVSGVAGAVLVSDDGGETWSTRRTGLPAGLFGISWRNPRGIAVGERGEIRATSDLGQTWREPGRPPLFTWLQGIVQPGERRHLFTVGEKGVVLRSDDLGSTWTQLRGAAPPPLAGRAAAPARP
jgi:photosystem II stability/assembly factor-like uncharacterized protein